MIEKAYHALDEAAKIVGCKRDDLIYLGACEGLPIYVLADDWWVESFCKRDLTDHEREGEALGVPLHPETGFQKKAGRPFQVSGPIKLYPETLMQCQANPSATVRKFIAPYDPHRPEDIVVEEYRLCAEAGGKSQHDVVLSQAVLLVMADDLQALKNKQPIESEKPLGKRERDTLLVVIAALAKLAEIDLLMPTKAAGVISKQTELMGTKVATRTIENHINHIPLELREATKP